MREREGGTREIPAGGVEECRVSEEGWEGETERGRRRGRAHGREGGRGREGVSSSSPVGAAYENHDMSCTQLSLPHKPKAHLISLPQTETSLPQAGTNPNGCGSYHGKCRLYVFPLLPSACMCSKGTVVVFVCLFVRAQTHL